MKIFEQYLIEDLHITDTRAVDLAQAMDELHRAMCKLDSTNLAIVHQVGLTNLMRSFSQLEQVHDVMPDYTNLWTKVEV